MLRTVDVHANRLLILPRTLWHNDSIEREERGMFSAPKRPFFEPAQLLTNY